MYLLKNSRGEPDGLFTIAVVTVAVVLLKVLLAGATVGGASAGAIDAGTIAALLTPTVGAYTWKRVSRVDQKE